MPVVRQEWHRRSRSMPAATTRRLTTRSAERAVQAWPASCRIRFFANGARSRS